jgi:hypothetical protein
MISFYSYLTVAVSNCEIPMVFLNMEFPKKERVEEGFIS